MAVHTIAADAPASAADAITLFPDTQFFLHFKNPPELPWADLVGQRDVRLVVGRTVQREINEHAYAQRGRRKDRAKSAAGRFREIVTSGAPVALREASPRVTLDLALRPPGFVPPPQLDPVVPDDQAVADALGYASEHPGEEVAILTYDAGMLATARLVGMSARYLPDEWLLPPENGPEQKEVARLKLQLADLTAKLDRRGPRIDFAIDQAVDGRIDLDAARRSMPSSQAIDALVSQVVAAHPAATVFDRLADSQVADPARFDLPSPEAIARYEADHRSWGAQLRPKIEEAAKSLLVGRRLVRLDGFLANTGVEYARDLRITIETSDTLELVETDALDETDAPAEIAPYRRPPTPPAPREKPRPSPVVRTGLPHGVTLSDINAARAYMPSRAEIAAARSHFDMARSVMGSVDRHTLSAIHGFDHRRLVQPVSVTPMPISEELLRIPRIPPHDPEGFYWRTPTAERNGARLWSLECDRFPHGDEVEPFDIRLLVRLPDAGSVDGWIRVSVRADNLVEPFKRTFGFHLEVVHEDTLAQVAARMTLVRSAA